MSAEVTEKCPWCDAGIPLPTIGLCADCRNDASGLGNLSEDEMETLPYGIIKIDIEGTVLRVNESEQRFARLTSARAVGKNFFSDVAPCTQIVEFQGRFQSFLQSNRPVEAFWFTYRFPDRQVNVLLQFVRVSDGAVVIARRSAA